MNFQKTETPWGWSKGKVNPRSQSLCLLWEKFTWRVYNSPSGARQIIFFIFFLLYEKDYWRPRCEFRSLRSPGGRLRASYGKFLRVLWPKPKVSEVKEIPNKRSLLLPSQRKIPREKAKPKIFWEFPFNNRPLGRHRPSMEFKR